MSNKGPYNRRGMTLIELSIVTGITALLLAMILGLSQHVGSMADLRAAQIEIGRWHLAMDNWHQTFGEYPGDIIRENGERESVLGGDERGYLSNTYYTVSVFLHDNGSLSEVAFRSYCTQPVKVRDPWGTPYIYLRDQSRQSYELFSCGPDAQSPILGGEERSAYDDIRFER